ncbi:MAG: zinc ABC transporter substrate-binding protein [Opitutales bacterium]|nr:zinc ABC transporter substrate-binding protein [Opitutales bacterium]
MKELYAFFIVAAVWGVPPALGHAPVRVQVSVPPQLYLVERIGGDRVEAEAFVPAGESCESFQPRPGHVRRLAGARVFFAAGLPYEATLVPRLGSIYPDLGIVDTVDGLMLREEACCAHGHRGHSHGSSGHGHAHGDPHVWMSPALALAQAARMRDALADLDPSGAAEYERNFRRLEAEIESLDAELTALLAPFAGRPVFVYHPAFGYFTDAYGLKQVAIEHNGAEPSPARLARLVADARERGVRVFFVQPSESTRAVSLLADAVGGRTEVLDPMRADWADNLREIAGAVAASYADAEPVQ